jgi:hypothetical protein
MLLLCVRSMRPYNIHQEQSFSLNLCQMFLPNVLNLWILLMMPSYFFLFVHLCTKIVHTKKSWTILLWCRSDKGLGSNCQQVNVSQRFCTARDYEHLLLMLLNSARIHVVDVHTLSRILVHREILLEHRGHLRGRVAQRRHAWQGYDKIQEWKCIFR